MEARQMGGLFEQRLPMISVLTQWTPACRCRCETKHRSLRGHTGAVLCLVLDTPSHTAFTGSTDATIRAWDILSGEQLRVFREHQGSVICLEVSSAWPSPGRPPGRPLSHHPPLCTC